MNQTRLFPPVLIRLLPLSFCCKIRLFPLSCCCCLLLFLSRGALLGEWCCGAPQLIV